MDVSKLDAAGTIMRGIKDATEVAAGQRTGWGNVRAAVDALAEKIGRGDGEQYTKKEAVENAEANIRYWREQIELQIKRSKSKDPDTAEDGLASIGWAREGLAKEERLLAKARARTDADMCSLADSVKTDASASHVKSIRKIK